MGALGILFIIIIIIVADVLDTKSNLSGCYVVLVQRSRCYNYSFISLYRKTIGSCNAPRTTRNFHPGLLTFWQADKKNKLEKKKERKKEEKKKKKRK